MLLESNKKCVHFCEKMNYIHERISHSVLRITIFIRSLCQSNCDCTRIKNTRQTKRHHTLNDLFTKSSTDVLKYDLHLAVSDPMSCFPTMPLWRGSDEHPATPGFKHQPTGSPLDPLFAPLALVNTIIAVLCSCGLHVNTVAVKGHHAPSKDDGSLKWALSVAAIFHLTGPTHTRGTGSL